MAGILARKIEMTRVLKGDVFIPVTLLEIPVMKIVGLRDLEKDGYTALMVGIVKKGVEGEFKKGARFLSSNQFSEIHEFRIEASESEKYTIGDDISIDILEGVEKLEITGFSKGKGFTGAMKKHNFHGGPAGHGSKFHRALGSIGNRKPTRTHKGKKMHGHHGNIKVTVKKVPLELVNKEISVIAVRGAVPGARKSLVSLTF